MKNTIVRLGYTKVWHFTDRRNLEGIRAHGGLYPRSQIGWDFFPGGNQWSIEADDRLGMQGYVHLCFLPKHPMVFCAVQDGRIDPAWLGISFAVLDLPGVLYCAGVANERGARYLGAQEAIDRFDFDHMYGFYDFSIRENMDLHNATQKYEILVPSPIPINLIEGL